MSFAAANAVAAPNVMQTHVAHKPRRAFLSIGPLVPRLRLEKGVRAANLRGPGATEVPAREQPTVARDRAVSCAKQRGARKTMEPCSAARARADDNFGRSATNP